LRIERLITQHWIWKDERKVKWWIWILIEVNHQDQKVPIGFNLIDCKRGQSVKSLETWAKDWRVDKSTVRRFFDLLQNDSMIRLENLQKTTRLTVCNYEVYNDSQHVEQLQSNSKATPKQLQSNTNKNDKKYKNGKNIENRPNGLTASVEAAKVQQLRLKESYQELVKDMDGKDHTYIWKSIKAFIQTNHPTFIEPYVDSWNVFAINYRLQKNPIRITKGRSQHFNQRIREKEFDFLQVLAKIKTSKFLNGHNDRHWVVSFDFIIRSEENYTKILEGKYDAPETEHREPDQIKMVI
jgi:hypothetical protein